MVIYSFYYLRDINTATASVISWVPTRCQACTKHFTYIFSFNFNKSACNDRHIIFVSPFIDEDTGAQRG